MRALEEGQEVGGEAVGGEGREVAHQEVGELTVEVVEMVEAEEMSERIATPPDPVYQVVKPDLAPVLDTRQSAGVEYEDWVPGTAGLPSKLLGTVTGRVPTVDGSNEDVSLGEELAQRQENCPGLLTLSVPGSVEHQQGVLKLSRVLERLEDISLVVILQVGAH